MLHRVWVIGVALTVSVNVDANGIYKCVSGEGIAYQSAPCDAGSAQEVLAVSTAESFRRPRPDAEDSARHGPSNEAADAAGGVFAGSIVPQNGTVPSGREKLRLGMTDDQALNTPGWGPPKKILRTREQAGWREVWTYALRASGAPQLEFLNGRLIAVSVQPDSTVAARIVSLSAR